MAGTRHLMASDEPMENLLVPSLKFGAACGGTGFLFGGTVGILKNTTPFLFASAAGIQTFALGTTFWGVRGGILQMWTPEQHTPVNYTKASAVSGGLTGGLVALATRGRRNAIPGAIMFAIFGFLGQSVANRYSRSLVKEEVQLKQPFWRRMAESKWSPVTVMSDEDYVKMLHEKMLKVDVEIALIDDKIAALKQGQQQSTTASDQAELSPER